MYRVTFSVVLSTAAPSDRAGAVAILLAFGIAIAAGTLLASPVLLRLQPPAHR